MAPTLGLALGKNVAMRFCCQQICWSSHGFQEGKQMVSWIGQEEFNSLGRDGVSALQTTSSAKPLGYSTSAHFCLTQGRSSDLATKETKKGKARKERLKHLLNPYVLRSSNESSPQSPVQVLGQSCQRDQVSSVALHLSLWERQQENTLEVVWILLDNFSSIYCHVKMFPRTRPKTSSDGHPLHSGTAAISGHRWSRQKICKRNQKSSSEASQCPCCPYNKLLNPYFKKCFEVNTKSVS